MKSKNKLPILLALITVIAVAAQAGVLVVNHITINGNYIGNPVQFKLGTNAGTGKGINGTDITVSLTNNNANASITFSIPPGESYFVDVLEVNNSATTKYYYQIVPGTITGGANFDAIKVIVINGTTIEGTVDLLNPSPTPTTFTIKKGYNHILVFYFKTNSGWTSGSTVTVNINLKYSTETGVFNYPLP